MGYCVASGGNFIGNCVASGGNFCGLLWTSGGNLWVIVMRVVVIFMSYCVASGCNYLRVNVWRKVVIFDGLLFGD